MTILRTILWVLVALGFVIFAAYNWQPVELRLWQNLVLETKVPMLALLAFAAGFLPMWLFHRSVMWGTNRRIRTLETSLRNTATAHRADSAGTGAVPVLAADSPVDKSGKAAGEPREPFDAGDHDGPDSGGGDGGGGDGGGGGGD
ncbi:hypothetical protein [Erythrobacter sp. WG]|uniref:hypothetical protein n=1 Tax=Erythrobacter sp. WG TaxID=2985510 RepID=UPI00226F4E68|nr:hypothetical protein [Erythrobacter sp. WG]MCX9146775.1 hypothetical protein [Erythrobacter sp. WG]